MNIVVMEKKNLIVKNLIINTAAIVFTLLVSACANTTVTQSWEQDHAEAKRSYKKPMVFVVSDSQQTRRIYEDSLIARLKDAGVSAVPSYLLIGSKQITQETIGISVERFNQAAYNNVPIDSVLISYLAVEGKELSKQDSPLGESYSGDDGDNMLSATLIVGRGRFNNNEVVPLKNDLYDVKEKSIVWSVQTETDDLTTIDALVLSVTEILVEQLVDDEVFE